MLITSFTNAIIFEVLRFNEMITSQIYSQGFAVEMKI